MKNNKKLQRLESGDLCDTRLFYYIWPSKVKPLMDSTQFSGLQVM